MIKQIVASFIAKPYDYQERYMPHNHIRVKIKMLEELDNNQKHKNITHDSKKNTRPKARDLEKLSKALRSNMIRRKSKEKVKNEIN